MKNYYVKFILILLAITQIAGLCDSSSTDPSDNEGKKWIIYNTSNSNIPNNSINVLCMDKYDHMWVGTNDGMAEFDHKKWEVKCKFWGVDCGSNCQVACMERDGDWMVFGTPSLGIHRINVKANVVTESWTAPANLPSNKVLSFETHELIYWIGTELGLVKYDRYNNFWETSTVGNTSLPGNIITAIRDSAFYPHHHIVGTNNGLALYDINNNQWLTQQFTLLPSSHVTCIASTLDTVWVGTENGLACYSNFFLDCMVYQKAPFGLPDSYITALLPLVDKILIGTKKGLALLYFEHQNWEVLDVDNSDLPDNHILSLGYDGKNIWIGTANGLAVYNKDGIVGNF